MKRAMAVVVLMAGLATGMPRIAECGIISPLVVLPTDGIQVPSGTDVRVYSAPMVLSSAFFDGKTSNAYVFSSESSLKKLITTDPAGNAATWTDSDVLAGISSRSGTFYNNGVVATFDYYPGGGANYSALYKVSQDGSFSQWKLSQDHGGAGCIISGVKNSLFLPAALPSGVAMQNGLTARVLKSNYSFGPIGKVFFGPDGSLYAFTSSANRKRLAKIAPDGSSDTAALSDVLVGQNLRAGALYGNGYVVAVDYAPTAGNQYGGIYTVNADGSYTAWTLSQSHSGISDLVPAPGGGYYFTDFENDNIWHITTPGVAETAVFKVSPVAPWSVAASGAGQIYMVNWIPGEWWSNGGVNAVYRVTGDAASLVALAPEGSRFYSIAAAKGGLFGTSFYVTDDLGGRVLRIEADNSLTPVVTGLSSPTAIAFDPVTGNMAVVCNGGHIIWFGANLTPFAVPSESAESLKGLYFADFENDNVWFVPSEGSAEVPIVETNVPPGLGSLAYNYLNDTIYALNWTGGWPFGGEDSVYEIGANGVATQVVKGSFASIAMSPGGPFGKALYLSDAQAGKILKLENGSTTPMVSGLVSPGAISFDPVSGNMAVICDSGRSLVWIGANPGSPAGGVPGTVGMFFAPAEQDFSQTAKSTISGAEISLEVPGTKPAYYSAVSKLPLTGDFEITASIRMPEKTLEQGQNRNATFSVVSDVAGQLSSQAYIGIMQKTSGYAGTGGQYAVYTDMNIISGWGRFNSRIITGEPYRTFKITRKSGVIATYYLENSAWVQLSTATDGFNDRVRIYFSVDTSWDASAGVTHSAVFNAIDMGAAFTPDGRPAPPTNIVAADVPNDNGHAVKLTWTASSSESTGAVSWYRIFRSRSATLTDPIPIKRFASLDSLLFWEERATILIDSVAAGVTLYTDSNVPLNGRTYYYWLQSVGSGGVGKPVPAGFGSATAVAEAAPHVFIVSPPYPNPFNPTTTLRYELPMKSHVRIMVFDALGRKVATIADGFLTAGVHEAVWNSRADSGALVGSGLYLYRFEAGTFQAQGKMLLVR
jgi:hypothetical protein